MNEIFNYLGNTGCNTTLVYVSFCLFILFVICYGVVSLVLRKAKRAELTNPEVAPGVSVIFTVTNQSEVISHNIETFLGQDYPDFEVIVVDECSEDDTSDVLNILMSKYGNKLRVTKIGNDSKFRCTKKIALNLGVRAAKNEILVFSDINGRPTSELWLKSLVSHLSDDVKVVVGYSNYMSSKAILDARRYIATTHFLEVLTLGRMGMRYKGNGYSLSLRKSDYLTSKGLSDNSQIYMGYESEMVKKLSKHGKVSFAFLPMDKVEIVADESRGLLKWLKREDLFYFYAQKCEWPLTSRLMVFAFRFLRFLFYLTTIFLCCMCDVDYIYLFASMLFVVYALSLTLPLIWSRRLSEKRLVASCMFFGIFGVFYRFIGYIGGKVVGSKWK